MDMWKIDAKAVKIKGQFDWVNYEGTWKYEGTEPPYCVGDYGTTKTKDYHLVINSELEKNDKYYSIFHVYK